MKKTFCVLLIISSLLNQSAFAETREIAAIFMEGKRSVTPSIQGDHRWQVETTAQMSITVSRGEISITVGASDIC
jgi:hypothetical protein